MAEEITIHWSWETIGQITIRDGKLVFPAAPTSPGVYRFTFCDAVGLKIGVYVGETDRLQRRFQHYRTPGPSQATNLRLNPIIAETIVRGGRVSVEIIAEAQSRVGDDSSESLNLTWKTARVLVESAAELAERIAGSQVLNR